MKWSESGPGIVNFGAHAASASAADLSSLAASSMGKAKDVAYLAKHYGRCYWELSKARLRCVETGSVHTLFFFFGQNFNFEVLEFRDLKHNVRNVDPSYWRIWLV